MLGSKANDMIEGEHAVSYRLVLVLVLVVSVSVILRCLSELEDKGPEDELGSCSVPLADLV